jgi:hypothetical protein
MEFLVWDYFSLLGRQASLEGASTQAGPHVATVRLRPRALGQAAPCLITSRETVQDSHRPFPRVKDPWDRAPCSSGEGSSPQALESVKKGFCPCQRGLSCLKGDYTNYACWEGSAPKTRLERIGVQYYWRTFLLRARGCLVMSCRARPWMARSPKNLTIIVNTRSRGAPRVSYDTVRR